MMIRPFSVLALFLLSSLSIQASHFLGGYISVSYTGSEAYIEVNTWTDPGLAMVDRCNVVVEIWTESGTVKLDEIVIPRVNGPLVDSLVTPCDSGVHMGEYIVGNIKRSVYEAFYTLPGPELYLFRMYEETWTDSLLNFNDSGFKTALLETSLALSPSVGDAGTPRWANDTTFFGCVGSHWVFYTDSYDPQGDSIVFEEYPCQCHPAPCGYLPPDSVGGGDFHIGSAGNVHWNNAAIPGAYGYSIWMKKYRAGTHIGTTKLQRVVFVRPLGCTVALDPAAHEAAFACWPNPALETVVIQCKGDVTVSDALGRDWLKTSVQGEGLLDLSGLPSGMYFIRSSSHPGRILRLHHL